MLLGCGPAEAPYSTLHIDNSPNIKIFVGPTIAGGNVLLVSGPSAATGMTVCKADQANACVAGTLQAATLNKTEGTRKIFHITRGFSAADASSYKVELTSASGKEARTFRAPPVASSGGNASWKAVLLAGDASDAAWDNATRDIKQIMIEKKGVPAANFKMLSRNTGIAGTTLSTGPNLDKAMGELQIAPNEGCFVYLTSHGSKSDFYINGDANISPTQFDNLLTKHCGTRPTVAIVSACYSGIMINNNTKKPNRIILTAARSDRTSFGCNSNLKYTHYDECVVKTLPTATTWAGFYKTVSDCIYSKNESPRSEPQAFFGSQVANLEVFKSSGAAVPNPTVNPNTTPQTTTANLGNRDIGIKADKAQTASRLSAFAAGAEYLVIDLSQPGCGPCKSLAQTISKMPSLTSGTGKCRAVTIVDKGQVGGWLNFIDRTVNRDEAAKHSFETSGISLHGFASTLGLNFNATPTVILLHLDGSPGGKIVQTQTGGLPSQVSSLCGTNLALAGGDL